MNASDITAFRADAPQQELDDLRQRLSRTRFPDEITGVGRAQGVPLEYLTALVAYWVDGFDWRVQEAKLNAHPQFTATVDGLPIHFIHVRSPEPDALAVIATHGWPMSVFEYVDLIGPLTDPRGHGGDPADAVDLVIPSLPGFGFSGRPVELGWGSRRTARAWAELMARLGYDRYVAIGNDAGSLVSPEVGRADPDRCAGVHVTQLFSFPSGDPEEFAALSPDDLGKLEFLQKFNEEMSAFNQLQSTQPQTLAYALHDSPAGQLGWSCQLFGDAVDRDYILANVTLYWLTRTAASSARFYWEDRHDTGRPAEPTTTATAIAVFANDFRSIRPFAERDHRNIVQWTEYDRGSHFAAQDAPDLLVDDVRRFLRTLR